MWNKLSQAAGLGSVEDEDENTENKRSSSEDKEQLEQQEILIQQLKDLVRENEKRFQDKSKEYDELSSKFQKFKLQSKAKISHLSNQIKEQDKPKKEDCDFDDASSSDSSDQSRRGKVLLLKKQLEQVRQQLEKKEQESKTVINSYERKIQDLELQLNEKNILVSSLASEESLRKELDSQDKSPKKESNVQEMYAQVVYKDAKIMELNNQILEHEKKIMDLQEHIKEKDEVLQQRNKAVQLMAEDMSRKGKSVVDELDETREQMKIMQENFSLAESDWKKELEKYKTRISELENEIVDYDKKLKNGEATLKSIENARYELSVKNAELQKKIVFVQESAAKQCEIYNKEIGGEIEALKKSLEAEKQRAGELQKSLDESSSQSDNKVLKARVKERTKLKALERELNELKKATQQKPEEVELQQRIAELEEEKGSLQLKLMDIEEQVIQLDKLKEENETLQKQNEKLVTLEKEKSELQKNFSSLCSSKEEIETYCNKLKEEYSSLQEAYNNVAQTLQQLQDQKVTFELKNIELEEIKENEEKEKKELLAKLEQLKESYSNESKPDIQLEKENCELKERLKNEIDNYLTLEKKSAELLAEINSLKEKLLNEERQYSSEIDILKDEVNSININYEKTIQNLEIKTEEMNYLQDKLASVQKEHSLQFEKLNNKLNEVTLKYEEAIQNIESKAKECVAKDKMINELKNNFSNIQNELTNFYYSIGAKDINDCKNYILKKEEEYNNLRSDFEKVNKERDNLNLILQGKDEEMQQLNLKIDNLQSILKNRDDELKKVEIMVKKLKGNTYEQENLVENLSAYIREKDSYEKSLMETIQEKTQLLLNSEQLQKNLEIEIETLKENQNVYQEKIKANNSSMLGQISDLETELHAIMEELSSKTKIIDGLNETVLKLERENKDILVKVKEKEAVITEKKNTILNNESTIKLLEDELQSLKDERDCVNSEISNKEFEVKELNQTCQQMEKECEATRFEYFRMKESLQNLMKIHSTTRETIQDLTEKNAVLENEKLHSNLSFTEKDAAYKQVLTEKMHLETEIQKLLEDNKSLNLLLKEKDQESNLLDETICKMTNLADESDSNIQDFLLYLSNSNNRLRDLADKYFTHFKKLQYNDQSLMSKNSELQNKVEEMQITINEQELKLQESNSIIDNIQKEVDKYLKSHEMVDREITNLKDCKFDIEKHIKVLLADALTCAVANNHLKKEHLSKISALNTEITKSQSELKKASEAAEKYNKDMLRISEEYDFLRNSVEDYRVKEEINEKKILDLSEKNKLLEENNLKINQQLEDSSKNTVLLENKIKEINLKFSEKKSLIKELKKKLVEYENASSVLGCPTSELKDVILRKNSQITELGFRLERQEEKLSNLQTLFDQKLNESKKLEHLVNTQFPYLVNCKQHYCMMTKALISSFQIDADVSFLESEEYGSLDDFTLKSKSVVDLIVECSSKIQSLKSACNSLENELQVLQEENSNLSIDCNKLKNYLNYISDFMQNSLKENNAKFEVVVSAFLEKENAIEKLKSKLLHLSKFLNLKKNQALEEEKEKDSYLERLNESMNIISEKEKALQNFIEEQELKEKIQMEKVLSDEEKYAQLHATLQEEQRKYENLSNALNDKQAELDSANEKIESLVYSLNAREEEIVKIQSEYALKISTVNSLRSELQDSHSSIRELQNQIRQLSRQISDYEEESHVLESSNNISNRLQEEVEDLKRQLSFSEEQKNYLQQHIDNSDFQLQSLQDEKSNLESNIEQMQHNINNLIETNNNLSNSLEESKSVIEYNEEKFRNLEQLHSNYISKYENVCQELKTLKLTKSESESKEKELMNKISFLEANCETFKNILIKISSFVSNIDVPDSEFLNIDIRDETLKKLISELHECLVQSRKHHIDEKNNLENHIKQIESKSKLLSEELEKVNEKLKADQKGECVGENIAKQSENVTIVPSHDIKISDANILQQQASPSDESYTILENDNKTLKREVEEYKIKFAKVLSKLKLFKDKNEKLNNELQELKNKSGEIETIKNDYIKKEEEHQTILNSLRKENDELSMQLQSISENNRVELNKANQKMSQLKERNSVLDEECCRIRRELQDYKQTWERSNVSYELQKEDNEKLRERMKEINEQSDNLKTKLSELNLQLTSVTNENLHLKQEAINLREHANMLTNDNDTYQELVENLASSKILLEQKLSNLTEKFKEELKVIKDQHELEMKKIGAASKETMDVFQAKELENECIALKNKIIEMQQYIEKIERDRDISIRNQNLLEKEKVYLQQQLLEKVEELQMNKNKLEGIIENQTTATTIRNSTSNLELIQLEEENMRLKSQLNPLMQELNLIKENFEIFKQDFNTKEKYYVDTIRQLEIKLQSSHDVTVNIAGKGRKCF
ncbi:uncharacterized protein CDAR_176771 [Caerostris darwini]|uniref:Uncharacterized protein n=1 Tax=Caerostris darwini TaxID=1538125 RepID=A0AAV4Q881_9ARAC|nr:uncharacterized protein CDAR_176771 [Caerostris darwini]